MEKLSQFREKILNYVHLNALQFFRVKSSNQIGQHPKKTERSFKAFSQRSHLISQLTVLVM